MYKNFSKRILDIIGASFLLILLFPIMGFIGLILLFYNKGRIFYAQIRPGKGERPFLLYKFQTMRNLSEKDTSETDRITRFGTILRKTSLDELPQLLNVLKGDMSFIGPRPLLLEYLPLYSDNQRKRHFVLPGITGWAQINGRNTICWEEKFILDLYYIDNVSFWLDLKILFSTFLKVFSGKGVYSDQGRNIEKFIGN